MTKPGYSMPSGEYRRLDNRSWYEQGRADQRKRDWPVIAACLIALGIFIVWGN